MITVSETKRYYVKPKEVVAKAFEGAYVGTLEKMPQSPPDYLSSFWGAASVLVVAILYYITAVQAVAKGESPTLWYALSAVCVAIPVVVLLKLRKAHVAFRGASGGEEKKEKKRTEFYQLMKEDQLPEEMSAAEFTKQISPMLGRQADEFSNNALRRIADFLGSRNNPSDIMCKLVTPFGDIFTQAKRRFYLNVTDNTVTFYDTDFSAPLGEITCSMEDVVSFGSYSKYPQKINAGGGGKIRPDSVILELQDEQNHIYFEFPSQEADRLKKLFPSKKELK